MMRHSSGRSAPLVAGLCAAAFIGFAPPAASAAGFAIFEQGARGMGFAGAFTAQSDPSAIFHNAAGIAFLTGFVSQASFWLLEMFPALGTIG